MSRETPPRDQPVALFLDPDEALVLFEVLYRWTEVNEAPSPGAEMFEAPAECAVLHGVLGRLESTLVEPFDAEYRKLLGRARERLNPQWSGRTLRD